jgi:sulfate transport system substrate-binding protein
MADTSAPRTRPWLRIFGVAAVVLAAVLVTVKNLPDHTPNQILRPDA